MFKKLMGMSRKVKLLAAGGGVVAVAAASVAGVMAFAGGNTPVTIKDEIVALAGGWPQSFMADDYVEPEFVDDKNRTNNAFNVADFGEQGNNGWFYRYGSATNPAASKRMESFDGEKYFQLGKTGMEIKSNFIHTAEGTAPILEWRAAKAGDVNVSLTYVKNVNMDKNPSYPDGVTLYVYKGDEPIGRYEVDVETDGENVIEKELSNLSVEELESLYFIVDPNMNNAYDGGSLYVAINDVNAKEPSAINDLARTNNNANLQDDFGAQGQNGWTYRYGKSGKASKLVSTEKNEEYMNVTSPNLVMSHYFIHPAINDNAIIGWKPAVDGTIEIRGKYKKFEQNDGNPDWPDGVIVSVYKDDEKLFSKKVTAPKKGENEIAFREKNLNVTTADNLYFVVDAGGNSSYDGGCFDINIIDRTGATTEADVAIDETETRQNFADTKYDFGEQGKNGFFYQDGFASEPTDSYNMMNFEKEEERYFDSSYLEIKRDFVNPGKGKSAVIKWKVAQTGKVKIDAAYTKLKNEDKNPDWPDGTVVTIFHNNKPLISEDFAPDRLKEVTKRLDVAEVEVAKDDYITMVVDPKANNAYDAGKYEFSIKGISPMVGKTEKDVTYTGGQRTNNASAQEDFGAQGNGGYCYQSGYYLDPNFAVNLETYKKDDKYTTIDGVEIKRDYIMPGNKGRSAIVKWVANQEGSVDVMADYTKHKNEDKNLDWPDGVDVYIFKNDKVLKKESFAPVVGREVNKDLSVNGLMVKPGDCITLMVDGKENTAYDGGNFKFVVEDAELKTIPMVNKSGKNIANLALDFGAQGSNGWYYCEGRGVDKYEILQKKTEDGSGYISRKQKNLEIKKDFVQPRLNANAMYKWVVAANGQIDITGDYTKFGNEDPNMNWPDGTRIGVYINRHNIIDETITCPRGEDRHNTKEINIKKLNVHAGDVLTFEVNCNKNNAWDGGRFNIDIADSNEIKVVVGDEQRTNNTVLGALTSMAQGTDGWWFLDGKTPADAKVLTYLNADGTAYMSTKNEGLEMKKDYVHPGKDKAAIYQWVAYEDGKIDIIADYVKFGQNDSNPNYPDGVKVSVYKNNDILLEQDVEAFRGDGNDNKLEIMLTKLDVVRGDKISFVIDAKSNNAWDAGRLSASIYAVKDKSPEDEARTNNTNLFNAFGEQGSDGWYYGMCDWNGANFERLTYDAEMGRYYNNGKPELKADFVEPGNGRNAAYQWVVAKTGRINIKGSYTKFANNADPEANGVCMRIFVNGEEKKWIGGDTQGNFASDVVKAFDETYLVHEGDVVMFAIDSDGNDSYDGGKLDVTIKDADELEPEEPVVEEDRNNETTLKDAFGKQGENGWFYGTCDWDGKNFEKLPYDAENNRYYNGGKPELKADFVEPGNGKNAAYKWVVGKDGNIRVQGSYTKFANSADPNANGTCMRIFLNGVEKKWLGGVTQGNFSDERTVTFDEHYEVKKNDEITFAIDPDGNDAWDGGRLEVKITDEDSEDEKESEDEAEGEDEKPEEESESEEVTDNKETEN
ncbi:MAG: hypothetical protein E7272_12850 [Pseudobutyrivibrio ruminis]|uniref:Uncharacterized protein n=1 Tax=Pseudobutyrivibrio ruminis TaxID=46206 RepID=A0A927UD36_9FIRM|nr:hypothetical protein [Pseudobutyrivibrio ruminis]